MPISLILFFSLQEACVLRGRLGGYARRISAEITACDGKRTFLENTKRKSENNIRKQVITCATVSCLFSESDLKLLFFFRCLFLCHGVACAFCRCSGKADAVFVVFVSRSDGMPKACLFFYLPAGFRDCRVEMNTPG